MIRRNIATLLVFVSTITFLSGCPSATEINPRPNGEVPPRILWAWERAEDLRFLDPKNYGVAYLAQTLTLSNDNVAFRPRRQPLELPENVYLIAVTRIETVKEGTKRPTFSAAQRAKIIELITKTSERQGVKAIQTDFDVVVSERGFYRELITDLRKQMPENKSLTITSLASWCIGDSWFKDFPIDEAVPMAFVMGADSERVRDYLAKGNDWTEPLCRESYGVSLEEPLPNGAIKPGRRIYAFKSRAWDKNDLLNLP